MVPARFGRPLHLREFRKPNPSAPPLEVPLGNSGVRLPDDLAQGIQMIKRLSGLEFVSAHPAPGGPLHVVEQDRPNLLRIFSDDPGHLGGHATLGQEHDHRFHKQAEPDLRPGLRALRRA